MFLKMEVNSVKTTRTESKKPVAQERDGL